LKGALWLRWLGAVAFILFGGLLILLPVAAGAFGSKPLAVFDSFYRAGSLVLGRPYSITRHISSELV